MTLPTDRMIADAEFLANSLCGVEQQQAMDIACHVKALAAEVESLRKSLIDLTAYGATVQSSNTQEWMEAWVTLLNASLKTLADRQEFVAVHALGDTWIEIRRNCEHCGGLGTPAGEAAGLVCGGCMGSGIASDEEPD